MGRYQFIGPTFAEVAPLTGLPDNTVFNAKTQDLFAITRLIQRASWGNLQSGLKSEWIGLQYLNSEQYQRLVTAARGAIQENMIDDLQVDKDQLALDMEQDDLILKLLKSSKNKMLLINKEKPKLTRQLRLKTKAVR